MSGVSERDEVFLAEMGIGPLWRLRAPVAAPQTAAEPDVAAVEVTPVEAPVGLAAARVDDGLPRPAANLPPPPPPRQSAEPAPAWSPPARPVEEEPVDTGPDAAAIARMDWDELHAAIAACTRCGACRDGAKPVFGAGARAAQWLVAAGASTSADEKAGQPLAGDPGTLLDNMLAAVEQSRATSVYVTNLVKCRPSSANGGDRAPSADEAAACRPFIERELALTGATTVLTLGQIAANGLLGKPLQEPLAASRGDVHALAGVALVATLHPGELLRRGADKALAWADLCRARAAHARGG